MKLKYIYNHKFANWLIGKGCPVVGAGVGTLGDPYVIFVETDQFSRACLEWKPLNKSENTY